MHVYASRKGRGTEDRMTRNEGLAAHNASQEPIAEVDAETRMIVETRECPDCGNRLRRHPTQEGWWQCEQAGPRRHRARPNDLGCTWQAFCPDEENSEDTVSEMDNMDEEGFAEHLAAALEYFAEV